MTNNQMQDGIVKMYEYKDGIYYKKTDNRVMVTKMANYCDDEGIHGGGYMINKHGIIEVVDTMRRAMAKGI